MYKIYKVNELGEQTVSKLFNNRDRIDFSPYYQRFGGLWGIPKRRLLIDTIINNYDIPKFYFNYFIESNNPFNINNSLYAIIDGKQRLQAIFDFLDNKYSLDETCHYLENPDINLSGLKFNDLVTMYPNIANKISNAVLDVIFIVTDEEERLEELFLRLNGGVSLTNVEKRNAISSIINNRVREIINIHPFFTTKLRFKNVRFQHNDLLTKLFYIHYKNELVNLSNKALEEYIRSNSYESIENESVISETVGILDKMVEVFEDNDILLKGKGIIPVYFYFIRSYSTIDSNSLNQFFNQLESLRIENRKLIEPISILQEFDLFNQQGVHRDTSLQFRYKVICAYFEVFQKVGKIDIETSIQMPEDNEIDNFEE